MALERSRIAQSFADGIKITPFDLAHHPQPVCVDLACSFEVAEHVPEKHAGRFVRFLCDCNRPSC